MKQLIDGSRTVGWAGQADWVGGTGGPGGLTSCLPFKEPNIFIYFQLILRHLYLFLYLLTLHCLKFGEAANLWYH